MPQSGYEGAYTPEQQRKNREQDAIARQKEARRKTDTSRKVQIGGLWLKYFPECKEINPRNKSEFAGIARAFATLANDQQFIHLWVKITNEIKRKASEVVPAGPDES